MVDDINDMTNFAGQRLGLPLCGSWWAVSKPPQRATPKVVGSGGHGRFFAMARSMNACKAVKASGRAIGICVCKPSLC